MKRLVLLLPLVLLGCNRVLEMSDSDSGKVALNVLLEPDRMSKSAFVMDDDFIENVNIAWYGEGLLVGTASFDGNAGNIEIIPGNYSFYAIANVPGFEFPEEEESISSVRLEVCLSECNKIPMSSGPLSRKISSSSSILSIPLKRLAAKLNFSILNSYASGTFSASSFRLMQCANSVLAFTMLSAAGSSEDVADCDYASPEDIQTLNSGGEITLYAIENAQGIFPVIDSPGKKQYDQLCDFGMSGLASRATYLEVSGIWSSSGLSAPVTYRMYLGANPRDDFNVLRNKEYDISLCFGTDPLDQYLNAPVPIWKMSVSDIKDIRAFEWEANEFCILPGESRSIAYSVYPETAEYDITVEDNVLIDGEWFTGNSGVHYCLDKGMNRIDLMRESTDVSSEIITCSIITEDGLHCEDAMMYKLGYNNSTCYFALADDYLTPISDSGLHDWDYDFSDIVFVSDYNPSIVRMYSSVNDRGLFTEEGRGNIVLKFNDFCYEEESDILCGVYSIDLVSMKGNDNLYIWLWNLSENLVSKDIAVTIRYEEDGQPRFASDCLSYSLNPYSGRRIPISVSSTWGGTFLFLENFYYENGCYYYPVAALDQCVLLTQSNAAEIQIEPPVTPITEYYIKNGVTVPMHASTGHYASYDSNGQAVFNLVNNYSSIPNSGVESILISIY